MKFQDFIEQGKVRKGNPDIPKSKSLVETSNNNLEVFENIDITETSAQTITANYYEALREIIEAICLKEVFKVYSHEAFTFFLKEKNEELLSMKFDNYRKIRNSINYYGEKIQIEEAKAAKENILEIIKILKNRYLKELTK